MTKSPEVLQRLQTLRQELSERLTRIRRDRLHTDRPLSADFADQAVERQNDEVLDRLETATASDLHDVEHALERFNAGLYGICELCAEPIEPERQQPLPQATTCKHCTRLLQSRR